jgi:hypothetical protein
MTVNDTNVEGVVLGVLDGVIWLTEINGQFGGTGIMIPLVNEQTCILITSQLMSRGIYISCEYEHHGRSPLHETSFNHSFSSFG